MNDPDINGTEPELRQKLRRAAAAVPDDPRWDDLTSRIDRAGRRRYRAMAAVVVVALIGGPAAGFAAGRLSAPGNAQPHTVALGETGTTVVSPSTTVPGAQGSVNYGLIAPTNAGNATPSEPLDRLFDRTSGQISLRVFAAGAQTNGPCNPIDMIVEASSPAWISASSTVVNLSASPLLAIAGVHPAGQLEGGLSTIVVVQVNSTVATVRLQIPGGGTDSMTPDHGTAVLAAPAGTSAGTVEALGRSGQIVATVPVVQAPIALTAPCGTAPTTTPSTLPPPGPQPTDPAAAKAGVLNAFAQVYQLNSPNGSSYVSGWTSAIATAFTKVTAQWKITSISATINSVVFTSPTTAAIGYNLLVPPFGPYNGRVGNAVLDQGVWKVASATVCGDISLGGTGAC